MWSFQWADHELIWWTKWHEYFFIVSVINTHQNDLWLPCHSISCARLLNISLNTEVYIYDLKMCDRDHRYVMDSIFWLSCLSDILSCDKQIGLTDSDCTVILLQIAITTQILMSVNLKTVVSMEYVSIVQDPTFASVHPVLTLIQLAMVV